MPPPKAGTYREPCPVKDATVAHRKRKPPIISGVLRERATGVEPATSSLGSWHSTAELRPRGGADLRRLSRGAYASAERRNQWSERSGSGNRTGQMLASPVRCASIQSTEVVRRRAQ